MDERPCANAMLAIGFLIAIITLIVRYFNVG